MNNTVTCLKYVNGLAQSSCICSEDGRPETFARSLSGRYIADQYYGLPMDKLEQLTFQNDDTVWDWLEKRREAGTLSFLTDLALNIPEGNRMAYSKYAGFVGDVKEFSYALSGFNAVTGMALHPKLWRGVQASIKGIRIWYPGLTTGTINIHLSTDLLKGDTTPAFTVGFTGNTGQIIHLPIDPDSPIEIDLSDQYGEPVSIFVTLANGGNAPLNTRFFCSTCGIPAWGKFFSPQNISVANNAALIPIAQDHTVAYGSANYGIALDLVVECSDSWLCTGMNYTAAWPRIMAEALQLYQQRDCFMNILRMEAVNPHSIFGRDETYDLIKSINEALPARMTYLGYNVPINLSDCLVCDDKIQVVDMII